MANGERSGDGGAPEARGGGAFPDAVDAGQVGSYPALVGSGGGYVYDEVLEYRVWVHDPSSGDDSYRAFATHDEALRFSRRTPGAEEPLVLVRQLEHVNEPEPGVFEHVVEERLTEWRVEWLEGHRRGPDTIPAFIERMTSR